MVSYISTINCSIPSVVGLPLASVPMQCQVSLSVAGDATRELLKIYSFTLCPLDDSEPEEDHSSNSDEEPEADRLSSKGE